MWTHFSPPASGAKFAWALALVTGEHTGSKSRSVPISRAGLTPDDSIECLMERYVKGDTRAFEALYMQVSPRLFGYLLRLCRDRQNAEDLVQVTFTKVHRARDSYIGGAPLLPWLMAIARRSFFDLARRKKVRPEYLSSDGALPEPEQREEGLNSEMADALDRALSRLPPSYAEAIQLTKITGLSLSEAAEVLGTSNTAVKLRVHRGYKLLRKELERFGRDPLEEGLTQ